MTVFFQRFLALIVLMTGVHSSLSAWWWGKTITGEGEVKKETREIGTFQKLTIIGSIDVDVEFTSGQPSCEVQAQANLLPHILTEIDGRELKIFSKNNLSSSRKSKVRLRTGELHEITLAGSGSLHFKNRLKTNALELSLASSGSADIAVEAKKLSISIAGSGDVEAEGEVTTLALSIAGSGDFAGGDLRALSADLSIVGSGDAKVNVDKVLDISIIGSGDVSYYGNPFVSRSILGSGSIVAHDPCQ